MSVFTSILFLQDYSSDAGAADDQPRSYAQGFGNHVASARTFAPLGHVHADRRERRAMPAVPDRSVRRTPVPCAVGGYS